MDLPPADSAPASSDPASKGHKVFPLALAATLVLLLGFVIVSTRAWHSHNDLVWMTPGDMAQTLRPGPFIQLRRKLANLTRPIWQRFRRSGPNIKIQSKLVALPVASLDPIGLPPASTTNADGTRAWILSPTELSALEERLAAIPGRSDLGASTLFTADGRLSRTFMGDPLGVNSLPVCLTIDTIPKFRSGSIKVITAVTATEKSPWLLGGLARANETSPAQTNLPFACKTLLPNGGALVVAAGNIGSLNGSNYWLIVCPTAVDSRGLPLKP